MPVNVLVNGAHGKMGHIAVTAVNGSDDLHLVAQTGESDNLANSIQESQANVVIDFTTPQAVFENTQTIIKHNAHPVIGTTGLTAEQIQTVTTQCQDKRLGGLIVPNFSLGAILMMRYAQDAAKYLPDAEIIEMHHPQKLDAPSGTAIKTAQMMATARDEDTNNIPIHSVRLPGFYSHQSVIFGSTGEIFTISHQGIDRECCIPGIVLACQKVTSLDRLIYGLDELL